LPIIAEAVLEDAHESSGLSRAEDRNWVKSGSKGFVRTAVAIELRAEEAALGVPPARSVQEFADWVTEGVAGLVRQSGGGKVAAIKQTRRLYGVLEAQAKDWVEKAQPSVYPHLFSIGDGTDVLPDMKSLRTANELTQATAAFDQDWGGSCE
jgi:ribosomal protein L7/L12